MLTRSAGLLGEEAAHLLDQSQDVCDLEVGPVAAQQNSVADFPHEHAEGNIVVVPERPCCGPHKDLP